MWRNIPQSKLHEWFSKWHKENCKRNAWLTDIDRLWVEWRSGRPVAVFDIKDFYTDPGFTNLEKGLFKWFERRGVPCYIIRIDREHGIFNVSRPLKKWEAPFSEYIMALWINLDLPELPPENPDKLPEELYKAVYRISG